MRLSYCFPTPERIIEGTRRLGEVLAYEAGVMETFGTVPELPADRIDQGLYSGPGPNQT
jgi:hypothetical protein